MGIVKQRKKRLLAWILTIVLCVGVWQGSVYATEGSNGGSVSGNDGSKNAAMVMSTEPQNTEPAVEPIVTGDDTVGDTLPGEENPETQSGYEISIQYAKGAAETEDFKSMFSYTGVNGEVSGASSVIDIVDGSTLILAGSSAGGEHDLLSWSVCDSSGSPVESGTGNEISTDKYSWSMISKLEVYWQKILDITINGIDYRLKQENKDDDLVIVSAPEVDNADICREGRFFTQWSEANSGGTISVSFGDVVYENRTMELKGIYNSMEVPISGTFALTEMEEPYTLSPNGTWTVNDDGYTYSGGISFYSDGKTSYTFNMTSIAE